MIRSATSADAAAVARVQVRTWQQAYAHLFPSEKLASHSLEKRTEQWRRWPPVVAERNGEIVGFVSVGPSRDEDADGELYAIYVDPDHWRTGIGRELLRAGEQRLRQLGETEVVLWVFKDNPGARAFYEAAGWRPDGTTRPTEIFGVSIQEVRYRKTL
jgi:ribosomal protein S18 acetylase RimI-like enzyme